MSSLFIEKMSAQPGPQTDFLRSPADICIYGGAAGGGKTVGLILEPLRYVRRVANFTAVFFRRTTPQITNPGGLWDESESSHHLLVQADILSVLQDRPIDRAGSRKSNWIRKRKEDVSRCSSGSGCGGWGRPAYASACRSDWCCHYSLR